MNSISVKKTALNLGAILCGIAPVDRFQEAPQGFHPRDTLSDCQSVIVVAGRFLTSTLNAGSTIPYTTVRNDLTRTMDHMTVQLAGWIEEQGAQALPTGAIGPTEWDAETQKHRGIISLKHAAALAGLGKIGKNTLLVNDRYGNMIWLGAVVTSAVLEPDPLASYEVCPPGCSLCLKSCPIQALDGVSMDQLRCWNHAFGEKDGGEWRIKCFTCRKVCPQHLGIRRPGN